MIVTGADVGKTVRLVQAATGSPNRGAKPSRSATGDELQPRRCHYSNTAATLFHINHILCRASLSR